MPVENIRGSCTITFIIFIITDINYIILLPFPACLSEWRLLRRLVGATTHATVSRLSGSLILPCTLDLHPVARFTLNLTTRGTLCVTAWPVMSGLDAQMPFHPLNTEELGTALQDLHTARMFLLAVPGNPAATSHILPVPAYHAQPGAASHADS